MISKDNLNKDEITSYNRYVKNIDKIKINNSINPNPDAIDKIANDLIKKDNKRDKKNKKRNYIFNPNEYVDSINDKNEKFNKKLKKAFDTTHIKLSLETGIF